MVGNFKGHGEVYVGVPPGESHAEKGIVYFNGIACRAYRAGKLDAGASGEVEGGGFGAAFGDVEAI